MSNEDVEKIEVKEPKKIELSETLTGKIMKVLSNATFKQIEDKIQQILFEIAGVKHKAFAEVPDGQQSDSEEMTNYKRGLEFAMQIFAFHEEDTLLDLTLSELKTYDEKFQQYTFRTAPTETDD